MQKWKSARPKTSQKAGYAPAQVEMDNSPVSNLSQLQSRRTENSFIEG